MREQHEHVREKIVGALRRAAGRLVEARQSEHSEKLDSLTAQVDHACTIAVVGRMKAGKSSFINALLGQDLAKVGTTETTATINRFVYGTPDPDRPVRCFWRDGRVSSESREFLDSLQGNDEETLRRAMDIDYLEYELDNDRLRDTVLVDTPGMCTTVKEHEERTASFLQLIQRHNESTERLGSQADAIIYLVGEVARQTDQAFLQEFQSATGGTSSALNAVGVMAKVDLSPSLMDQRLELSSKVETQLRDSINAVVPVSAGIQRALDRMESGELPALDLYIARLREIPPQRLVKFLDNEDFYRSLEPDDCPVSIAQREELLADLPWSVFTALARVAAESDLNVDEVKNRLIELAGFDRLTDVLDRHLFRRSRFLHAYHILQKAEKVIEELRFKALPDARRRDREMKTAQERYLSFVRQAAAIDPVVSKEVGQYLEAHGPQTNHEMRVQLAIDDTERELAALRYSVEGYGDDFEALQIMEREPDLFDADQLDELRALFGMYGDEPRRRASGDLSRNELGKRQVYWRQENQSVRQRGYTRVAELAAERYGALLAELS